jgi:immune inhibitor A
MKEPYDRGYHPPTAASLACSTLSVSIPSLHPLITLISAQTQKCGHHIGDRCLVAPAPELKARIDSQLQALRERAGTEDEARVGADLAARLRVQLERRSKPVGMDDGMIFPGFQFDPGTPAQVVRAAAAERAPLRGVIRVVVVLAEFTDRKMEAAHTKEHFNELFFSTGVLPNGSVKEYFDEVAHGLIRIEGEVVGPYQLPNSLQEYANGESGTGPELPNARTMARDAAVAADRDVDFAPYDNDGNGFVDAFIVVHAGGGAEQTGSTSDIWSHKWVLAGGEYNSDGTRIFAYLTVPEDCRIGVCSHELGHLIFGWPDLYDTDDSSEGLGNWCLMAGGSWNADGDIPAHPSAWCKAQQGWVSVSAPTNNGTVNISDVKDEHTVYRLWKDGVPSSEYFLVENRQRRLYDRHLPGDGLLLYHVDETIESNANENRPKVALVQADGNRDLERHANRGDAGDPFPGSSNNTSLTATSDPNSKSYGGISTCVQMTNISQSAAVMSARLSVECRTRRRIAGVGGTRNLVTLGARVAALEAAVQGMIATQRAGVPAIPSLVDQPFDLSEGALTGEPEGDGETERE